MNTAPEDYLLSGGGPSITALPKISLHDHLDGGLRPATIIELADTIGATLPVSDAAGLGAWFAEQSTTGSLVEYLKSFEVTNAVMQTEANLVRVAREFVADLAADGVIYGEVRWAPELHTANGLSLDATVEAVQAGVDAGVADVRASGSRIRVGQILSALRNNDRGLEIAQLAVRYRDAGVVGFDIAGPEAGFPASGMREAFDFLAQNMMPVTVHAGEGDGLESIRGALVDGRALRLGHGVRIAEDIAQERQDDANTYVTLGRLAQWVKDRGIPLELSPTSNVQTGAIAQWGDELIDHPFDVLYQLGFAVTVNTDNRLMSSTSLSRELALLSDAFSYDLSDLEVFQVNAANAAFLSPEDREDLVDEIAAGFENA